MIVHGAGLASQPPYCPGMDRRCFLLTSLAGVIGAPVGGGAQAADRVWRVGILMGIRPTPEWIAGNPFFVPMRELGWVDGKNVVFEQRYATNNQSGYRCLPGS